MQLNNLTIVQEETVIDNGAITIDGGLITSISHQSQHNSSAFDGAGLIAIPGMIDLHGDMIEREIEPRPRSRLPVEMAVLELDKRMASAGITTSFAALSFAHFGGMEEDTEPSLRVENVARHIIEEIDRIRPQLLTDIQVHARFEVTYPNAVPVLGALIEKGLVKLVSLMDHTPGQGQFRDLEQYISYMANWYQTDRSGVEANIQQLMDGKEQSLHNLQEIGKLAVEHGLLLASHDDDTRDKVAMMGDAQVTLSEFPITLEAAAAAKERGMWVAMGAPNAMRGKSHSGNLSAKDALDAGLLDILMTDYYPPAMLQAAFQWIADGALDLPEAVRMVATNPAKAARLTNRGSLSEGFAADIALIAPGAYPRVVATMRNGQFVYRQ